MAEPLTKICDCTDGTMCIEKHVDLDRLKSALEWYLQGFDEKTTLEHDKLLKQWQKSKSKNSYFQFLMKKAFPAIYDNEKVDK